MLCKYMYIRLASVFLTLKDQAIPLCMWIVSARCLERLFILLEHSLRGANECFWQISD